MTRAGTRRAGRRPLLYNVHTFLILGAVATGVGAYMMIRRLTNFFVA